MAVVVAVAGAGDVVKSGLRQILGQAPDLEVLDAPSGFGVVPDVVLYDVVGLTRDDGVELRQLIGGRESAVVAIARDLRPDLAARALACGVVAWVSIEGPAAHILSTVRAAAMAGPLDTACTAGPRALGHEAALTPREVTVLACIVKGLGNREIAALHELSPNTVKSVIRSAYRRMGVTTRAQAVAWGIHHGFEAAAQLAPNLPASRGNPGHLPSPPEVQGSRRRDAL